MVPGSRVWGLRQVVRFGGLGIADLGIRDVCNGYCGLI